MFSVSYNVTWHYSLVVVETAMPVYHARKVTDACAELSEYVQYRDS